MDISHILKGLNNPQRDAVTTSANNMLVLAGAGSGKTRVLVHRIAWIIKIKNISKKDILAVTFTNKAALEMRSRIEKIIGLSSDTMWIGTFHSLAYRLLRTHWKVVGLPQKSFLVLDADAQIRLIKRIIKNLDLDEKKWLPKQVQCFINSQKDQGYRPEHINASNNFFKITMVDIYQQYENICYRCGIVDFAELLLRSYELWLKRPDILQYYQKRFSHILVDEFQDTNNIQYAWLRLLAGNYNDFFVVGDDDQSIYGWRGAKIENIYNFRKDFPNTQLIRLEQNYRSTGNILKAANAVIANNPTRFSKNLWTNDCDGDQINLYAAFNELDEVRFIINCIKNELKQGRHRTEIAILYRTTAQSRLFEEALVQANLPYYIYGGIRFFERLEIKDALAYLRIIANREDDSAFERVVNQPPRGIGSKTLDIVRSYANNSNCSMWKAANELVQNKIIKKKPLNALDSFITLIEEMAKTTVDLHLEDAVDKIIQRSKLKEFFYKRQEEKKEEQIENLEELVNAARQFKKNSSSNNNEDLSNLEAFLAHISLGISEQSQSYEDSIHLMTLHSSKGLEFPIVFISGIEEGLFPHNMSSDNLEKLEEERRLCYVGITRAMDKLTLSYAKIRRLHGSETYPLPSRFLREIPKKLIRKVIEQVNNYPVEKAISFNPARKIDINNFRIGQYVTHSKFGKGIILNIEGDGASAKVKIKFRQGVGFKWLVLAYANLKKEKMEFSNGK